MIPFYTSYNSYLHFSCIHEGRGSWRARKACCKPASSLPVLEELKGKDVRCEKWNEFRLEGLVVKIPLECHTAPTPAFDVTNGWKECSEAYEENLESGFKISTQSFSLDFLDLRLGENEEFCRVLSALGKYKKSIWCKHFRHWKLLMTAKATDAVTN